MSRLVSYQELKDHAKEDDLWLLIHGKVYNVTSFVSQHPGGKEPFLNAAGKDATPYYDKVHTMEKVQNVPADWIVGDIDPATLPKDGDGEAADQPQNTPPPPTTGKEKKKGGAPCACQ